ncbi:MAG: hypothetical protein ACQESR_24345 [Planctomycetota bacterium]
MAWAGILRLLSNRFEFMTNRWIELGWPVYRNEASARPEDVRDV